MITECLLCGSPSTRETSRERRIVVNGNEIVVPDDRATRCDRCSETFYTGAQARVADRKLIDARRRAERLLTSAEIRHLRDTLNLSQSELEQAIGIGPKTVVRWENGTSVQSKAADDVLRLVALDPDNLRLLVRIRKSTISALVEHRLEAERTKTNLRLEGTLSAALTKAVRLDADQTAEIVKHVSRAIRTDKTKHIEREAKSPGAPR
jgi:HTH-type transcriptional regulator/antitoxin MqsA